MRIPYYGVKLGDRVREHKLEGVVIELDFMDNNRVYIQLDDGQVVGVVAEWCEKIVDSDRK